MHIKIIAAISLLITTLSLTGCNPGDNASTGDYLITMPQRGNITADQLAQRLNMKISNISKTDITLKSGNNTVMIFTHAGGKFFVNGRSVDYANATQNLDGSIYLPESIIAKIKSALPIGKTRSTTVTGTVVIDAGHGGTDPGAIAVSGYYEKNINLQIANKVAGILKQKGIKVITTRPNDVFVELNDRADIANRYSPDLFVSIHADSSPTYSTRGFSVYIAKKASADSASAARNITNAISANGLKSLGIRKDDFRVLVRTKCPAVLIETGYISNSTEASLLSQKSFQDRIAKAIADGIIQSIR